MMRSWDIKEVFVVDGATLRGVLTDVDIVVLAIASGRSPADLVAGDCLTPATVRLRGDEPILDALGHLRHHGLRRAPVVDGDQLIGAVWITDLEQACQREPANCGRHGIMSTSETHPDKHRTSHARRPASSEGHRPRPDRGHGPRVIATTALDPSDATLSSPADPAPGLKPVPLVSTPLLSVMAYNGGLEPRLTVAGELDLSTTPLFGAALEAVFEHDIEHLTIDLQDLTFADSSAVHALLHVRAAAHEREIRLRLTNVAGSLERTLVISGMHELFEIVPG